MGQAAGALAALAARGHRLPHDVPWPEVRAALDSLENAAGTAAPAPSPESALAPT
jgi:hypothetical protein